MTQTLLLTRGLPASGKSTFAEKIIGNGSNWVRLERDLLRDQLYKSRVHQAPADASKEEKETVRQQVAERENTITKVQFAMAEGAVLAGKSIVVSDTNLRAKYVRDWMAFAKKHNLEFNTVNFDSVSVDECVRRDEVRQNSVGEKVIRDMAQRYLVKGNIPDVKDIAASPLNIEPYDNPTDLPKAIIVDIDGTLAKMSDRSPYDWHRVDEDEPIEAVIIAVHAAAQFNRRVIVMSGRDESCRAITEKWLTHCLGVSWKELHMRPEGDNRKDDLVKYELFNSYVRDRYHVDYVLDDRPQVCRMWRKLGLFVFQCGDPAVEF